MIQNKAGQQAALDPKEQSRVIESVIDTLNGEFRGSLRAPTAEQRAEIADRAAALVSLAARSLGLSVTGEAQAGLVEDVMRRATGLGFLDELLPPARADLSEITMYSEGGLVQVMKRGEVRWETINLHIEPSEVYRVIDLLLGPQAKALTEATPEVIAKLPATPDNPGGGRVTLLHPIIAPGSGYPSLNIRLFEQKPVLPEWLLERRVMSEEMMADLGAEMKAGTRILISGPVRTGKTTLLSALCNFLPRHYRIVKIEDPLEIWIDRPTVQTIEARVVPPGAEVPPYTLRNGVDIAMRMSPDYLIVGEVRDGRAAYGLFRAMMSGHAGACTFHANSPQEAFKRLSVMMGADEGVPKHEAYETAVDSIDLVVQLGLRHEKRRVTAVARVAKELRNGKPWLDYLYRYDEASPEGEPDWVRGAGEGGDE
jgi:pilus assembly protein CpaF